MTSTLEHRILVRLSSELSTKARGTRRRFTRKLAENVRAAIRSLGHRAHVEDQWNRLVVQTDSPAAVDVLARVPGISSSSLVEARCGADLPEILRVGVELFGDRVKGRTYAVRAKRSGTHPYSSHEVQQELGAALNEGATVDLSNPEVVVEVEIRDQWAYLFSARVPGLGGLPLGVEGRALCLISGGFDSAVAAWLMLKRGVELDYVFFNLAGEAYERSVVQVTKVLADRWSYGTRPKLHVLDFGPTVDALKAAAPSRYWQLLLKRLMYRAAAQVAVEARAGAIVTGEAIGQVSSQTLANLAALEGASALPVFRPLLGFDKQEIIERTVRIGTFELSSKVKEYCAIAPGNPVTSASRRAAEAEEAKIDLQPLHQATARRKVIDLAEINAADLIEAYLYTERVPEAAVVIDLRSEPEWEAWHYPGALRREPWELSGKLDADRTYVIYCDAGTQAAFIAEQLQRRGIEAYAFRGGTRAIRGQVEGSATP